MKIASNVGHFLRVNSMCQLGRPVGQLLHRLCESCQHETHYRKIWETQDDDDNGCNTNRVPTTTSTGHQGEPQLSFSIMFYRQPGSGSFQAVFHPAFNGNSKRCNSGPKTA